MRSIAVAGAGLEANLSVAECYYARHRPKQILLYQFAQEYCPALVPHLTAHGTVFPEYVQREFAAYRNCGRLEQGFLSKMMNYCACAFAPAFGLGPCGRVCA